MGRVLVNRRPPPARPPRKDLESYATNPTFDTDSTDSYGMERRARVRPRRAEYYYRDPIDSRVWDRRDGRRIDNRNAEYTDSDSYDTLSYDSWERGESRRQAPVRRYRDEYNSYDSRSARESIDRSEFREGREGPPLREYRMSDYEFEDSWSNDESTLRSEYTSESRSTFDSSLERGRRGKHMLPPRKRGPVLPPISSTNDAYSDRSSRYSGNGRQNSSILSVMSDASRLSAVSEDESAKLAAESLVEHLKKDRGFSLRKDGIILSSGSSMTPDRGTDERYLDPETAAKSLIESLASMGYSYDTNDGVKQKESRSTTGESERYRMGSTFSGDSRSGRGSVSTRNTRGSNGTKESSTKESSAKESSAKESSTKESSSKESSVKESIAKDSSAKHSKSTTDSSTRDSQLATITSKELGDLLTRVDGSDSESATAFDESTISTKDTKFGGILKRPKPAVSEAAACEGMSKIEDTAQEAVEKKVEWAGEMPPPTSSGARVPELVKSFPQGVLPNISDLTSVQHMSLDSASYPDITNLTEDRIERFFEQVFLSCRLALYTPKA
jgi:hypothetical protein